EVLARTGSRNLESSTRSRSERSSLQSTPQPAASDESSTAAPEPITVYPDVSTISIDTKESPRDNKDASRVEGSVRRPREELRRHSSLSSVAAEAETDSTQRDRSKPRHQMGHHQPSPDRRSSFEENLIAALRDESISTSVFQQRATRLVRLLIEEALTCLPHEHVQIKNQFGDVCHATKSLDERGICGVSMEDKGMVLLRAFSTISPTSPTGVVSIHARTSDDKNRDDGNDASRLRSSNCVSALSRRHAYRSPSGHRARRGPAYPTGHWRLHAAVLECPLRPQRAVKSSKVQSMQTTLLRTADLKYICDLFLV
ncbi:hypothetical protein C6341_g26685, partial [Phytophthora cactorum]